MDDVCGMNDVEGTQDVVQDRGYMTLIILYSFGIIEHLSEVTINILHYYKNIF
jgi:hypothetical protein